MSEEEENGGKADPEVAECNTPPPPLPRTLEDLVASEAELERQLHRQDEELRRLGEERDALHALASRANQALRRLSWALLTVDPELQSASREQALLQPLCALERLRVLRERISRLREEIDSLGAAARTECRHIGWELSGRHERIPKK